MPLLTTFPVRLSHGVTGLSSKVTIRNFRNTYRDVTYSAQKHCIHVTLHIVISRGVTPAERVVVNPFDDTQAVDESSCSAYVVDY
eukprot:1075317-Amorphochlora_amoeboformis.AAC.1